MLPAIEGRLAGRLCRPRTHLEPVRRDVALTFDDGPDPHWTPRLLDALAAQGARATFFLVGERAARHPALVQRMVQEGHAVGSHSLRHELLLTLPAAALREAVVGGREAVEQAAGQACPLFRPPRGHLGLPVARLARRHALVVWMWSVEPGDWRPEATTDGVLAACVTAGPGDVVLLHDAIAGTDAPAASQDRSSTVAAVPTLVRRLADRGLSCAPLSRS